MATTGDDPRAPAAVEESRELVDVRLIGVPLRLYSRSRQRHEELMREFAYLTEFAEQIGGADPTPWPEFDSEED